MLPIVTIIIVLLCHCCGSFSTANVCGENDVRVKIQHGNIRGSWMISESGRCFQAYRGIPYAKPPVGDLRFRAPVEPDKWKHLLDATQDAPACIQKNILFSQTPEIEGLEDCLYLNVYTPKIHYRKRCNQLLPVMVFIHYGGFFAGSGRSDYHGPEYFMDKDVILVTFNYRLGVLGFLSTYDDAAPGNWGLKDQVAALRWVQDNIIHFGGNNKKVTLFGQSAGAASTHHHILSPSSKVMSECILHVDRHTRPIRSHVNNCRTRRARPMWVRMFNRLISLREAALDSVNALNYMALERARRVEPDAYFGLCVPETSVASCQK